MTEREEIDALRREIAELRAQVAQLEARRTSSPLLSHPAASAIYALAGRAASADDARPEYHDLSESRTVERALTGEGAGNRPPVGPMPHARVRFPMAVRPLNSPPF